jgi:hypothetical protein
LTMVGWFCSTHFQYQCQVANHPKGPILRQCKSASRSELIEIVRNRTLLRTKFIMIEELTIFDP